ncbi:hypothetical protein SSP531S_47610 [Streptomyces spongiicola]|uniref:Uncharacterized protein n=1 Tax=Streptomyces spongiicola TaxID=1690221 RepID=A0A388T541_9ACTN|nr:hypothetical protein SSP531S_47610 [Streptomyces spongiicola]
MARRDCQERVRNIVTAVTDGVVDGGGTAGAQGSGGGRWGCPRNRGCPCHRGPAEPRDRWVLSCRRGGREGKGWGERKGRKGCRAQCRVSGLAKQRLFSCAR